MNAHREFQETSGQPRTDPSLATPPERFSRFYSAANLQSKAVPPREWLVEGLVPNKTVTLFSGDGGTGKSLLAHQLAVAVASGCDWLGMRVTQGRVIFLSAEDDEDELHRRTDEILRATVRNYDDVSGLTLRSLAGEDALLVSERGPALTASILFQDLEARATNEQPALVVIDTLADVYPANENDRAKVRQFVGILRGLAIRQKCAVMLLAHPSLSGLSSGSGMSGSTAWNNSVRSRLYMERITEGTREPDPDRRRLRTMKANYGPIGGEISLTWRDGVFVAERPPTGLDRLAANARAERVFLALLDEWAVQGRHVSASPGVSFAPTVFAALPKAEGMTKHALRNAMEALFSRGELTLGEHGRGVNARKHIERATGAGRAR
ncbi:AAA family ATPase [Rubellimicrobium rubrum]|nr:AAA family ATPase [Rubellimicrobium rubrum]